MQVSLKDSKQTHVLLHQTSSEAIQCVRLLSGGQVVNVKSVSPCRRQIVSAVFLWTLDSYITVHLYTAQQQIPK